MKEGGKNVMKKRFTIVIVSGVFLAIIFIVSGTLVISSGTSFSESAEPSSEKELLEMIENKGSPEAHEALASYYRSQAEALKQKAKQHETMAVEYKNVIGKGSFATHCQTLSEYYKKAAEENEALAKEHEEMAESLRKKKE